MTVAMTGLAVAILGATPALGLTLDSVTGSWSNVVGGTNVGFYTVGDEAQVRWGEPDEAGTIPDDQSGLGFTGAAPPPLGFDAGDLFEIGTLRHFNHGVQGGTAASSADLTIMMDFGVPDLDVAQTFTLSINETPNSGPCVIGSPPCSDIIGFPSAFADETFDILGVPHTLEILGFQTEIGGVVVDEFISNENSINSAVLVGRITRASAPVPEPTSALMFGVGCLVVTRSLRRRPRPIEG
jgi:hypothetical protein